MKLWRLKRDTMIHNNTQRRGSSEILEALMQMHNEAHRDAPEIQSNVFRETVTNQANLIKITKIF